MATGISALTCRLDSDIPAASGGVDWADLVTFLGGTRPSFAGKYFIGSPWRWVHGEATSLIAPLVAGASLRVAPIAAADSQRQASTGQRGLTWGYEDGSAAADAIQASLSVGDLAFVPNSKRIYVYLEVADGTALTPEYWSTWATAVTQALLIGKPSPGELVPMMQGLLPCIATRFVQSGSNWEVPALVRTALETSIPKFVFSRARCHGFWALTMEPAAILPAPVPAWPNFRAYEQPQASGAVAVPVRLWRYASGNPAAPVNQVGRVSVDFTAVAAGQPDAALDGMLLVKSWTANNNDPTQIGVDRGLSVASQIRCLTGRKLRVEHLPERTRLGTFEGPALAVPIEDRASFVIRYISERLKPRPEDKEMSRKEAIALSKAKVEVVTTFQAANVKYKNVPAYLTDSAHGHAAGYAAVQYATKVLQQPAHTPIYFAIDSDVTTSGISTVEGPHCITPSVLAAYFESVAQGMAQGLADADPDLRVPYTVGVYGCARACEILYQRGLASYFWQAFPPFWGDDAVEDNSNGDAFLHAHMWQVGMEYVSQVMTSSRLTQCRDTWIFQHALTPGPQFLDIRVGTQPAVRVAFPTTAAALATATKALVKEVEVEMPGIREFDFIFSTQRVSLTINVAGTLPPGFDAATWGSLVEQQGVHDLNVAWGDSGGWSIAKDL